MDKLSSSKITEIINWLNSLRSVTDFEAPALSKIKETLESNKIKANNFSGGLLIGNPNARIVFMTHVDRIGFVAINGKLAKDSIIDLAYIAKLSKVKPKSIKERFSKTLLVGYNPVTGEDQFIASIIDEDSNNFQAKIIRVINNQQETISNEKPIPLTAVKSPLSQTDDYLQGYFDNSAGLAISIAAVAKYPDELSCIITIGEEGGGYQNHSAGGRGAQAYIQHHDFQKILVVIDVRPASLFESDKEQNCIGKGVVLREAEFRKSSTSKPRLLLSADNEVLKYVKEFSSRNNIQYQTHNGSGVTEAGRAYESLGKVVNLRCIWLQPPIANEHTQSEIVSLSDIEGAQKIAEGLRFLYPPL